MYANKKSLVRQTSAILFLFLFANQQDERIITSKSVCTASVRASERCETHGALDARGRGIHRLGVAVRPRAARTTTPSRDPFEPIRRWIAVVAAGALSTADTAKSTSPTARSRPPPLYAATGGRGPRQRLLGVVRSTMELRRPAGGAIAPVDLQRLCGAHAVRRREVCLAQANLCALRRRDVVPNPVFRSRLEILGPVRERPRRVSQEPGLRLVGLDPCHVNVGGCVRSLQDHKARLGGRCGSNVQHSVLPIGHGHNVAPRVD